MAGLDIKLERRPEGVLAHLSGSVDTSTVDTLDRSLQSLVSGGSRLVVIDLAGVDYVNSRGMALFIKHNDRFRQSKARLVLTGLNEKVLPLVEVMGLLDARTVVAETDKVFAPPKPKGKKVSCPGCNAEVDVPGAGSYRCERCSAPFRVSRTLRTRLLTGRKASWTRVDVPLKGRFAAVVRQAVVTLAEEYLLEGARLWRVVDEVLGGMVEAAATLRTVPILEVTLAADQDGMGVVLLAPEALKKVEKGVSKILEAFSKDYKKVEWIPINGGGKALRIAF